MWRSEDLFGESTSFGVRGRLKSEEQKTCPIEVQEGIVVENSGEVSNRTHFISNVPCWPSQHLPSEKAHVDQWLQDGQVCAQPQRRTDCYLRPVSSNSTLSLRPSLSSGIPDRTTLSLMAPTISLRRTLPLALTYGWKTCNEFSISTLPGKEHTLSLSKGVPSASVHHETLPHAQENKNLED